MSPGKSVWLLVAARPAKAFLRTKAKLGRDAEWAFVMPYLCLMVPQAPQRQHDLRAVFNALRWLVRTGSPWRYLPNDFPRWEAVYQQTQRWIGAQVFEALTHDLRALLREAAGRTAHPSTVIFDSRTLQSTPESGHRAKAGTGRKQALGGDEPAQSPQRHQGSHRRRHLGALDGVVCHTRQPK